MRHSASLLLAIGSALLVGGLAITAQQLGWIEVIRVGPFLEGLAITMIAVYTLLVSTRLRRSDVRAVVPIRVLEALDSVTEGLLILDENQQILLANQAFCAAIGRTPDQLIGTIVSGLPWIGQTHADAIEFPWIRAIRLGERQTEQLIRYRLGDQSIRVFSVNCSPMSGSESKSRGTLVTFRDVTRTEADRAEMDSRIRHLEILALRDPLTDCLNRRALDPQMQVAWNVSKQQLLPLACLMIDNDHFKQINDTHGHKVGDTVLRKVATTILAGVPEDAMVCRYGGEEFCVVLPKITIESAAELAEQIRQRIEQIEFDQPPGIRVTASIGVSETQFGASNCQELITQADQCLYLAKNQGRNRVVAMTTSMRQSLQHE